MPETGLSDPGIANPSFTPTAVGETQLTFRVTDSAGNVSSDTLRVVASLVTGLSSLMWAPDHTAGGYLMAAGGRAESWPREREQCAPHAAVW
jgi:hypothetical protein